MTIHPKAKRPTEAERFRAVTTAAGKGANPTAQATASKTVPAFRPGARLLSRAFRAFDDFLLPPAAFAAKRQAGQQAVGGDSAFTSSLNVSGK
jgi:hypothetical protein